MTSIRVFQHYTHHLYAAAALFEASLAFAAMMGALQLSAAGHLPGPAAGTPLMMIWQAGVVALAFVVASDAMGQYSPLRAEEGFASHAKHGAGAFVLALFGLLLLGLLLPSLRMNPLLPGGALLLTTGLIVGLRTPFFLGMAQRGALRQKVMIVGAGRNAQHALEVLRQRPERLDFDVVGCVPLPGEAVRISGEKLLPGNLPLTTLAKRLNVAQMIVVPDHETEFPLNDLIGCRFDGRQVVSGVQFFEREARILDVDLLPPDALAFGDGFYQPAAVAGAQARLRHRRQRRRAGAGLAADAGGRRGHQAGRRPARAGAVQADPRRPERQALLGAQVPQHAGGRRGRWQGALGAQG